ncbi:hypothetical protein HYW35_02955 [Candidatus Saccharibacteria bacterium]|nr:hypothetical protein [Candidatus Saccharibacteria bacterium]
MVIQNISTKELREQLPKVRAGLARGDHFLLIYRSRPIARLEPVEQRSLTGSRVRGGGLRLQANSKQRLTPEYLKKLASQRYE